MDQIWLILNLRIDSEKKKKKKNNSWTIWN